MTTPTVTELVRNGNPVGERVELGRYTIPGGQRILYGQRVDGVVRFLPGKHDVLEVSSRPCEANRCRPREAVPEAARTKRSTT